MIFLLEGKMLFHFELSDRDQYETDQTDIDQVFLFSLLKIKNQVMGLNQNQNQKFDIPEHA